MIEIILNFFATALLYCTVMVAGLWTAERIGWLRDGAIAEIAWRGALWLGILVAAVTAVRAPLAELTWTMAQIPVPIERMPMASEAARSAALTPAPAEVASERWPVPAITPKALTETYAARLDSVTAQVLAAILAAALLYSLAGLLRAFWLKQRLLQRVSLRSRPAAAGWLRHRDQLLTVARAIAIRMVDDLDSPIAAHSRLILLPAWCDRLDDEGQRALLAHELAHIQRGDPIWRLCDAIAVTLLAGLPFARYAQNRLHDLSEFACDAEAAHRCGSPRALAECLVLCLEQVLLKPPPTLAVAMVTPARGVVARVHKLLEEPTMFWTRWSQYSPRWVIAAAVMFALLLPGIAITVAGARSNQMSVSISSHEGLFGAKSISASFSDGERKLKIEIEGKVQFNDAETAVISISEGGSFRVVDSNEGSKRELRLEPEGKGFARVYRVDGDDAAFDADAERWFASMLPELFRRTGLDAEARLKRILARGGVEAALTEIGLIHGDYARSTYIGGLFAQAKLDVNQLTRVLDLIAAIEADYELRRALTPALDAGLLDAAAQAKVLALAVKLESDYERAELLIAASEKIPLDGVRLAAWQSAVKGIGSDYEKRRVLEALLAQHEQHPEHAKLAIDMAASVTSDYEKRMLLEAAARQSPTTAAARADYVRIARTIGSDYERRQALLQLFALGPVSKEVALDVIAAAHELGSDYEAKELLLALAEVMPADPQVIEAYRNAARSLAPHERGETEAGLDRFFVSA